jgi:hypothetical protein
VTGPGGARVSGRTAGWTAWGLWALTVLAVVLTLSLASLNEPSSSLPTTALLSLVILAFSTVGALIGSRRPENPIGWLFCSGAFIWILGELALEYGVYALITAPGTLPAGDWVAWFGAWARGMGWFLLVMFLLLLFPNGRLLSPRWRPLLWGTVGFVVLFTLVSWLSSESVDLRLTSVHNPLGIELGVVDLLGEAMYLVLPLLVVPSGVAVIVRFRRSRGDERQQLKWFAYAVALMVVLFGSWISLAIAGLVPSNALIWTVPLIGLPVAVGVAILRYRLYDIDLVINRTLVYGSLTALLVATYFGGVVLLQGTFRALTGQGSQLAIVASTLLIAALFVPLRRRVQAFIDHSFYRRKYDAAKTLEAFSTRLREKTDLDSLDTELLAVVRETVQPEHVSLWLRPTVRQSREKAAEHNR